MALVTRRALCRLATLSIARLVLSALCLLVATELAVAEDFRIETKVFVGEEEQPLSEATTLFHAGDVYDFLDSPRQTAVFRKPSGRNPGRFILLNDEQRIRTEIGTDQLAGAMEKVREWAGRQTDPFLKFAANPEFEETYVPQNGQLLLASHLESYTVETTPAKNPKALAEYRQFLDWYAQLNTLLSGGPPPQPRLELNRALERHKAVPNKVELVRDGEEPLRAEHAFTWRLSKDDMQRIDDVRASLASYRDITNQEYLERTAPAKEE